MLSDYAAKLGIDPETFRMMLISNTLGGLGRGLLSGSNWNEGLRLGLAGVGDALGDTTTQATRLSLAQQHADKWQLEQDEAAEKKREKEEAKALRERIASHFDHSGRTPFDPGFAGPRASTPGPFDPAFDPGHRLGGSAVPMPEMPGRTTALPTPEMPGRTTAVPMPGMVPGPGLSGGLDPQLVADAIRAGEMDLLSELQSVMFPKPETVGGLMRDPATGTWTAIPGYEEQQTRIRAAGRSDISIKSEGAIPPGYQMVRDEEGRPLRLEPIAGGPLTEGQSTGTLQFSMAQQANATLDQVENVLTSPGDYIASQFGTLGNYAKSDEYRQAEQAAIVLSEQYLRALTGAAATEPEVKRTARSILPVPADDAGTIAQKRATRAQIIEALRIKAGPGAAQVQPPTADQQGGSADVPRIGAADDYNALPSGTRFYDPDGVLRVKP